MSSQDRTEAYEGYATRLRRLTKADTRKAALGEIPERPFLLSKLLTELTICKLIAITILFRYSYYIMVPDINHTMSIAV